jgi:hypothetical protein
LLSGLCQMPGKIFPAFAAPDDDVLIILHTLRTDTAAGEPRSPLSMGVDAS